MRAELLQLTEVMAKEIFCLSHFREREERLLCGPVPYQLLSLDIGDFFAFPGTLPLVLRSVDLWIKGSVKSFLLRHDASSPPPSGASHGLFYPEIPPAQYSLRT